MRESAMSSVRPVWEIELADLDGVRLLAANSTHCARGPHRICCAPGGRLKPAGHQRWPQSKAHRKRCNPGPRTPTRPVNRATPTPHPPRGQQPPRPASGATAVVAPSRGSPNVRKATPIASDRIPKPARLRRPRPRGPPRPEPRATRARPGCCARALTATPHPW